MSRRVAVVTMLGGMVLFAVGLAGGCTPEVAVVLGMAKAKASLAADSSSDRPGTLWPSSPQWVHAGETVLFDLRVKPALDDYAVFEFPDKRLLIDANPVYEGYRVKCAFPRPTGPKGVTVSASAYRTVGRQDYIQVGDKIIALQSADEQDAKLATAKIQIIVYQSKVEFAGVAKGVKPDWSETFLRIIADSGQRVSGDIYQADDEGEGAGRGYRVTGPDAAGGYTVTYLPSADQVNRGGLTSAELHLTDASGKTQVIAAEFSTP